MTALSDQTVLPKVGRTYAELKAVLSSRSVQVSDGEGRAELSEELRRLLSEAVAALSRGQAVTLLERSTTLTTQQAADLLGISRPTLVKLLVDGEIPYEQPGRHRRVSLADLLAYKHAQSGRRADALAAMAEEDFDVRGTDMFVKTR